MRLEQALAATTALVDLPAVVEAAGGTPLFAELDPGAVFGAFAGRNGIVRAGQVGTLGALRCLGIVAAGAAQVATRVARREMARGEPALVFALDPSMPLLAIAIGADPPAVIVVENGAPDRTALASLRRIRGVIGGGPMATALRVTEALSGQRVDRRFFQAFREVRDRFAEEGPMKAPPGDRRALALLDLTRVLFLYFVQCKGWLDGRDDFLARAVDHHLQRRDGVTRSLLHPLFFGTLNRPEILRVRSVRRFGRIPFLNGGLFEPHPLERTWRHRRGDALWRDAFDTLFERFHFTVDERSDTGAIAPDMLGRVFEGLMAPDERQVTGTFYTPSRLVSQVVRSGACSLLAQHLGTDLDQSASLLSEKDPTAARILLRARILDPAVGSGAFLLGALDLLTELALVTDPGPGIRRRILRHQLFGIDLSAEAVRLAELRLWLAAVQDDEDGPSAVVEPLPNLDAALRQGDTLTDPRWLRGLRRTPVKTARALAEARRLFVAESGPGKPAARRALRAAEQEAAREALSAAEGDLDRRIATLLTDARTPDLFGQRRGLDPGAIAMLRGARADRRAIREAGRRLRREGSLPWFDAQSAFGEVFADRGGFDLVVGNPPWVRAEQIPARAREMLAARYRWWAGTPGAFQHRPDLSVAFVERGLELCAPGGALAMLLPAKIATAGYGAVARAALTSETTVDRVVDLTTSEAEAFAAVTYPMALVLRKATPLPDHRTSLSLDGAGGTPSATLSGAPWVLRAPDAGAVAAAIRAAHTYLSKVFPIHLGVKSGLNAAFLRPPPGIEREFIRPAVRGRGIAPFRIKETVPLLFPHDRGGSPCRALPPKVAAHLAPFRRALERRADAKSGPWWALHRTVPAAAAHRVAWSDLSRRLEAVALPRATVPLNSCYFATTPGAAEQHALTAWLNSTWIRAILAAEADPARGGFGRFNARLVGRAPWSVSATVLEALSTLGRAAAEGKEVADEIDRFVATSLGLDARDQRALRAIP